jgi:glutathione S-transferase
MAEWGYPIAYLTMPIRGGTSVTAIGVGDYRGDVGGVIVYEADNIDQAVSLAKKSPGLKYGFTHEVFPEISLSQAAHKWGPEGKGYAMNLYAFPASTRVLAIVALKHHLGLDCELHPIDLGRGDQLTADYVALNPNRKMPTLTDGEFVLWESNAILFYMASKRPESGLWPSDVRGQADVLRWLAWESAHWDAESCGMVAFEKASKAVLGLGEPDPAFIARGEHNFARFAAVLNDHLKGRSWLIGDQLTIADFSIGAFVPSAVRLGLPVASFSEIGRWYEGLAKLPAWRDALAAQDSAMSAWLAANGNKAQAVKFVPKLGEQPRHS